MPPEAPTADDFLPHVRMLRALAYRMTGSRADAEDVVQDAWLRWHGAARDGIAHPRAFLARTVTRLCLDRLQSAPARREQYVGVWLPEPLVDEDLDPGPEVATARAQDVSQAFLLVLHRLSPLERAAFVLHDLFDLAFDEIAATLQRSPAAVRQLASRARQRVRSSDARAALPEPDVQRLVQAFAQALAQGDLQALQRVLADDAVFLADGGGKVCAVPRPLHGAELVARTLLGFYTRADWTALQVQPARINGAPGWLLRDAAGTLVQTLALQLDTRARVAAIYIMRNPDKLRHVDARRAPDSDNLEQRVTR